MIGRLFTRIVDAWFAAKLSKATLITEAELREALDDIFPPTGKETSDG